MSGLAGLDRQGDREEALCLSRAVTEGAAAGRSARRGGAWAGGFEDPVEAAGDVALGSRRAVGGSGSEPVQPPDRSAGRGPAALIGRRWAARACARTCTGS